MKQTSAEAMTTIEFCEKSLPKKDSEFIMNIVMIIIIIIILLIINIAIIIITITITINDNDDNRSNNSAAAGTPLQPLIGAFQDNLPKDLHLRRSCLFTDTGNPACGVQRSAVSQTPG